MQGYVLEVKKFYCSLFVYSNFIMPCFGWMLLDPFFLITQKRIVQLPKITISQTQMLRTQKTMGQCHS